MSLSYCPIRMRLYAAFGGLYRALIALFCSAAICFFRTDLQASFDWPDAGRVPEGASTCSCLDRLGVNFPPHHGHFRCLRSTRLRSSGSIRAEQCGQTVARDARILSISDLRRLGILASKVPCSDSVTKFRRSLRYPIFVPQSYLTPTRIEGKTGVVQRFLEAP